MIGTITSGCRGKAVAPHHRCDRGEVGWASGRGVEDGRNLAEVVGAEDSGCHDRQRLRIDIARVVELVDGATHRLTPRGIAAVGVIREAVGEIETAWAQQLGAERFDELRNLLLELNQLA